MHLTETKLDTHAPAVGVLARCGSTDEVTIEIDLSARVEISIGLVNGNSRGETLEASRTAAINALVMGQIFYLMCVRQNKAPALSAASHGGNPWVYAAIGSVLVFQLLFTYWGPMTSLFGTAPIDSLAWGWTLMVGLLVFFAVEAEKAWRRRSSSAAPIGVTATSSADSRH